MSDYFLKRIGEEEQGPYSAATLKTLAGSGQIDPGTCYIRAADRDTWHPARCVKGLFPSSASRQVPRAREEIADSLPFVPIEEHADVYLPSPIVSAPLVAVGVVEDDFGAEVDEQGIFDAVQWRVDSIRTEQDWTTPSGKPRAQPFYATTIRNEYLGKVRTIKKSSYEELVATAQGEISKWKSQEIKQRVATANADLVAQSQGRAVALTEQARILLSKIQNILKDAALSTTTLDWERYLDRRPYFVFKFEEEPARPLFPPKPPDPKRNLLHTVFPPLWEKRLEQHRGALGLWEQTCKRQEAHSRETRADWAQRRNAALAQHRAAAQRFLDQQAEYNQCVTRFREQLDKGNPKAIVRYIEEVFSTRPYPYTFDVSHSVSFDEASGTVVVDVTLPAREDVTDVVEHKFAKNTCSSTPVRMKPSEHETLYDSAVKQTIIRTMYEVFASVRSEVVQGAVANGWVTYLDPGTGHDKTSCIISVSADRDKLMSLDLHRVDPSECIKNLKGLIAGPLSQIAPVQPIMQLNREDSRFVESQEVLAEMNATTNLAEIGWEEFEHLVRELFGKMFSQDGSEVRVTQTSSDGGVDAIAFDPDPIRGGKFVIQAKRYTRVVPVSAVRDLYGTMISEGASKGLLVTTAHFGRDSREFVKDKPISLIDGANLVYLLEQYGHKVRIDVEAARRNQEWDPLKR